MIRPRHDPMPISSGWELALAAGLCGMFAAGITALGAVGAVAAIAGDGWLWPSRPLEALGGFLAGRPTRGYDRQLPAGWLIYLAVALAEAVLAGLATALIVVWLRYRRPTDARAGMATRAEAASVLGVGQLRSALPIIRPDAVEESL